MKVTGGDSFTGGAGGDSITDSEQHGLWMLVDNIAQNFIKLKTYSDVSIL